MKTYRSWNYSSYRWH